MTSPTPFADLLSVDGVEERLELRGPFGFMAYHGGSLEEMTDVVASAAAERSGASYYGVLQPPGFTRHIPSHHVSPDESPTLRRFLDHVDTVITIHGFGRHGMWTTLLLGGQNRELAEHVAEQLRPALPGYTMETRVDEMPKELRGMHHRNPVNLPLHKGVQIELPPRVRGRSPVWRGWAGPGLTPHTEGLIDGLVSAATSWMAR